MKKKIIKDTLQEAGMAFSGKLIESVKVVLDGRCKKNSFSHMNLSSMADLIKYSTLVCEKQYRKAQIMQHNMDTSVYESIPNGLWEKIEYSIDE